ncbi:hypothetical protein CXF85_12255 [Colwellia sp. 75C3]|uniref:DUF3718 domain-containing protein n=1 Tax=Colwellia sp. 75C3 TaxID=888425 RepID=UPI000C33BCE9|nr:DUF3718 domain-containing protein [Colwellia sp. 75C3]PKG82897.1 hypothetical protein CXF85_12255 [Colwellia sp. 75C3]
MKIKKFSILIAVALSIACVNVNAQQYRFVANDNTLETKVCVLVGSNNLSKLKNIIWRFDINKKRLANVYLCNDLGLAKFAHKYNASETFKFINHFSNRKNKVETNVTISDIAMLAPETKLAPITVYVTSTD